MGVSPKDQDRRRKSKVLLIIPLPVVLAAVVDSPKLHNIHHLFPAISLMHLKNEETFPDLSYVPLKDFLGESDGLRIGVEGYLCRLWFSPASIPINIYKANSLYGSRWLGILTLLGPYVFILI